MERTDMTTERSRAMSEVKEVEELKELFKTLTIYGDSEIFEVAIWPQIKDNPDAVVGLMRAIAQKTVDGCINKILEAGYRRPASGSPLPVELDNQAIRAIIYMQLDHEDTYSDLLLIENQSAKNCFNAISKMCADEICSRFSQKVELDEKEVFNIVETELEGGMTKGWISGKSGFNTKLPWAIAKALCSRFSQKKVTKEQIADAVNSHYFYYKGFGIDEGYEVGSHISQKCKDKLIDNIYKSIEGKTK